MAAKILKKKKPKITKTPISESKVAIRKSKYAKYTAELLDQIDDYIDNIDGFATQKLMCEDLNISFNTWKTWLKSKEEVQLLRDKLSAKLEVTIFQAGLERAYDAGLVKFYMMSQCRWTTKQQDRVHDEAIKKNDIAANLAKIQLIEMTEALSVKEAEDQAININFNLKTKRADEFEDIDDI